MAVNLYTVIPKIRLLLSCHLVCSRQHLSACPGGARHLAGAIVQGLDNTTGRAISPLRPTFWKALLPCVSNAPQVLLKRPLVCTRAKKVMQRKRRYLESAMRHGCFLVVHWSAQALRGSCKESSGFSGNHPVDAIRQACLAPRGDPSDAMMQCTQRSYK